MGIYAQFVVGPAGSGKSTYCSYLYEHSVAIQRSIYIANLDPAAEAFDYPVSFDVRNLVTVEDIMNQLKIGPNGSLMYCMEFLEDNIDEWFVEKLQCYGENDYLIFDCPGQIELYSTVTIFQKLVSVLQKKGWKVCIVYMMDSHFIEDLGKFISGTFQALSSMLWLEATHLNILTKMDLFPSKFDISRFLEPDGRSLAFMLTNVMGWQYHTINDAVRN